MRRTLVPPIFRTRGEYIVSLIPKSNEQQEDEENDDEMIHDQIDVETAAEEFLNEYGWVLESPERTQIENDEAWQLLVHDTEPERLEPSTSNSLQVPSSQQNLELAKNDSKGCNKSRIYKKRTNNKAKIIHKKKSDKMSRSKRMKIPKKKTKNSMFNWKNIRFEHEVSLPSHNTCGEDDLTLQPIDYFSMLFTDEMVELIVDQTNLYYCSRTGQPGELKKYDILDFIAILLIMGITTMPASDDYWADDTRYDKVANIMPRNKFRKIRQFIHFNNNEIPADGDKCYKIRPLLDMVREQFQKIEPEGRYSVDEMMCPYKGRKAGSLRQYIKNKPTKWGFKFFVRAGVSGMIYDFFMYCGEGTFRGIQFSNKESDFSFSEKVVIALTKSIKEKSLSVIFFDNYFSTPNLMSFLREEYGILSLGVLRADRIRGAVFPNDKEMKKEGRGFFHQVTDCDSKVTMVKWMDSKSVIIGSSYKDAEPLVSVKRWVSGEKTRKDVPAPSLIKEYNLHMGGVDLADMFIALYRTNLRAHRYQLNIFVHLLDMCVNNAWLLCRRNQKKLSKRKKITLKKFKLTLAHEIQLYNRPKKVRGSSSRSPSPNPSVLSSVPMPESVRLDGIGHWPKYVSRGECRFCKTAQSNILCSKCQMRLCLRENKNCFAAYHGVKEENL